MSYHTQIAWAATFVLAGCANLATVNRSTSLPSEGVAIHLDAPQRVMYANKAGRLCAEPSPDALQAYASSFAGALAIPEKASASLTSALSADSAGLGLRTQSITLMRDTLYRICEAQYNGAIGPADTIQLLERSQDLSLGVLAIEQLTGAIVARQPILTTGANGTAAANVNSSQSALDQAKKDETAKKAAVADATSDRDKKKALVDKTTPDAAAGKADAASTQGIIDALSPKLAEEKPKLIAAETKLYLARATVSVDEAQMKQLQKDLLAAKTAKDTDKEKLIGAQISALKTRTTTDESARTVAEAEAATERAVVAGLETAIADAHKDPAQANYDKLAATLESQKKDLSKAEDKLTAASKDYDEAQTVTKVLQENLNSAIASTSGSTTGAGSFSPVSDRGVISKDTVAEIAKATVSIVDRIVNKGHLTDMCASLITGYFSNPTTAGKSPQFDALIVVCQQVLEATLKVYVETGGQAGPAFRSGLR